MICAHCAYINHLKYNFNTCVALKCDINHKHVNSVVGVHNTTVAIVRGYEVPIFNFLL